MAVCKFFLEGRCKFGDHCKFEHASRGGLNQGVQRQLFGGGGGGQQVAFRDSFGSSHGNSGNQYKWTSNNNPRQQNQHASSPSSIDLVNSLQKEIEISEKQWPFSCVSIEKDLPCLPEFYDWSPEELRFEAYTAIKSGDIQSYVTKVQQMSVDYSNKRQQLKNINPSMKQKLVEFIDDYKNNKGTDLRQSSFGGSSGGGFGSGSMFGGSSSGSSSGSFGQTAASSSIFGGGSSSSETAFGKSAGGLFGQSSTGSSAFRPGSTFGGGSGTTAFGGGSSTSGFGSGTSTATFGAQSPSHSFGTSTFGASSAPSATTPTSPASTFGSGSSSAFGSGTNNVFGGKATFGGMSATGGGSSGGGTGFGSGSTAGGTIFGSNASQGTFQNAGNTGFVPATQSTGFGGGSGNVFGGSSAFSPSSASSAFGAPSALPATSAFGTSSSPASSQSAVPPSGFFSGATPTSTLAPSVVPIITAANSMIYTPLEELTEEEKAQFSAPSFVLGKVPTKPPPRELING